MYVVIPFIIDKKGKKERKRVYRTLARLLTAIKLSLGCTYSVHQIRRLRGKNKYTALSICTEVQPNYPAQLRRREIKEEVADWSLESRVLLSINQSGPYQNSLQVRVRSPL